MLFCMMMGNCFAFSEEKAADNDGKKRNYVERYKDFYNPKNYKKNYKERFKPENYKKYYSQLHQDNFDSFKDADEVIEKLPRRDYINPRIYMRGNDPYALRDYQNEKRQYGDLRHRYPYPHSIKEKLFDNQRKRNNLPHQPNTQIVDPLQLTPGYQKPVRRPYNPFIVPPAMIPPHFPGSQIKNTTASGFPLEGQPSTQALSPGTPTRERPAEIPVEATAQSSQKSLPEKENHTPLFSAPRMTRQNPSPQPGIPSTTPRSPVAILFEKGLESFQLRNYRHAKPLFKKLTELNPGSIHAQFAYGLSEFYSSNYNESLKAFRKSFELSQQKNTPLPTLQQMRINPRDFRFHFRKLARYIEQHPDDTHASSLLLLLSNTASSSPNP